MKRFVRTIALAGLMAGVLTLSAAAQPAPGMEGHRGGARGALRCLRGLDLTDSQKADIKTILQDSRSTLQPLHDAVKADWQKLKADADAGADKAVIGQDFLNVRADHQKIKNAISAIQAQVASKLTSDQQAKFQACVAASKAGASEGRHRRGGLF